MNSAAGKTKGGFVKRDGRPSDDEVLVSRIIDRYVFWKEKKVQY